MKAQRDGQMGWRWRVWIESGLDPMRNFCLGLAFCRASLARHVQISMNSLTTFEFFFFFG